MCPIIIYHIIMCHQLITAENCILVFAIKWSREGKGHKEILLPTQWWTNQMCVQQVFIPRGFSLKWTRGHFYFGTITRPLAYFSTLKQASVFFSFLYSEVTDSSLSTMAYAWKASHGHSGRDWLSHISLNRHEKTCRQRKQTEVEE